jgi:serine/threonine-protein kinase
MHTATPNLWTPKSREVICERFVLDRRVGAGTYGEVWKAWQTDLSRPVAIKFLNPQFTKHPRVLARFQTEMIAQGRIRDPHVAVVLERGTWQGRHFFVQEFVPGEPLRQWITRYGASSVPPWEEALELFLSLCAAVHAAHKHNIVHLDIKPDNVLLHNRSAYVVDFGVAQVMREGETTELPAGTYAYMAPEHVTGTGADVSKSMDVFSLGVVFVEMLTLSARPPDARDRTWGQVVRDRRVVRSAHDVVPLIQSLRRDLPLRICKIAAKALAPKALDRYQDAGMFWRALRAKDVNDAPTPTTDASSVQHSSPPPAPSQATLPDHPPMAARPPLAQTTLPTAQPLVASLQPPPSVEPTATPAFRRSVVVALLLVVVIAALGYHLIFGAERCVRPDPNSPRVDCD